VDSPLVATHLSPDSMLGSGEFGGLSPDGRCFTFDARANGYVRGEGGAADGLTAPDPHGQELVLRTACTRAGVTPADLQYVVLHGTGTERGDRAEAAAAGQAELPQPNPRGRLRHP
jgi:acyl transferase domain-containing protein